MTDETVKAGDLKEGDRVRVVIEGSISFISANRSEIHIATSGTTSEHAVKVSLATITRLAPEPKPLEVDEPVMWMGARWFVVATGRGKAWIHCAPEGPRADRVVDISGLARESSIPISQ